MLNRIARSVRAKGIAGTGKVIGRTVVSWFSNPRLLRHAQVPIHAVTNPRHAIAWAHDRVSSAGPAAQGLPWIAWPCIDFMAAYLEPTHRVFEWGGGGSTVFFLKRGCSVVTVESSADWIKELDTQTSALGTASRSRLDLRYVAVENNDDPAIKDYIGQIERGAPWDLVMVDGWSRSRCLEAALKHVKPGGVLVLDNADQKQFAHVPALLKNWKRHKFRGLGVARSWVTQTDAYVRPPS